MKKETILATIFGVLLGLIVALILIFFLRPSGKERIEETKSTLTPKVVKNNIVPLVIKEEAITNKNESFKLSIPLARGENLITIRVYVDRTQTIPQIKTLKVYYLNEE